MDARCSLPESRSLTLCVCIMCVRQAHHAAAGTELPMEVAVLQAALQQ